MIKTESLNGEDHVGADEDRVDTSEDVDTREDVDTSRPPVNNKQPLNSWTWEKF